MDDRVKAVRAKDINGAMSNVAPDLLSFDVVNPLQTVGSGAARKRAADWSYTFQGPIGHEIHDLSITTGDDVAFSHSLNRVIGTMTDGKQIDMYWRATVGYRKFDGRWLVTHEHNSVPFRPSERQSVAESQAVMHGSVGRAKCDMKRSTTWQTAF